MNCKVCNNLLIRNKLENKIQFNKRVTCNRNCRTEYIRKERIGWHSDTRMFMI